MQLKLCAIQVVFAGEVVFVLQPHFLGSGVFGRQVKIGVRRTIRHIGDNQ